MIWTNERSPLYLGVTVGAPQSELLGLTVAVLAQPADAQLGHPGVSAVRLAGGLAGGQGLRQGLASLNVITGQPRN